MSQKEVDELMRKRKFTLGDEFRITYGNTHSTNKIETPWCSPIVDREHFRKILNGVKKLARKIEELYGEDQNEDSCSL